MAAGFDFWTIFYAVILGVVAIGREYWWAVPVVALLLSIKPAGLKLHALFKGGS